MWILDDRPGFKATGMFNGLSFLRARIAPGRSDGKSFQAEFRNDLGALVQSLPWDVVAARFKILNPICASMAHPIFHWQRNVAHRSDHNAESCSLVCLGPGTCRLDLGDFCVECFVVFPGSHLVLGLFGTREQSFNKTNGRDHRDAITNP
jgi:hypothetical protein